ncbi:hypothetical protein [Saccharicrinis aurantiacus]|uniref:hypothetical protein n=1 Tax=Saccharicrinis aurantiacus TaxID=1849719 RepID=UPI000838EB82|nr:hypothetical protein [Saccharicrinis aurantiacus]
MIVPTMNETEIKKEIVADFKNAIKKSEYFDNDFRRKVLKAKSYPTFSCFNYTSPLKNKWLILFEARSKKEFGKKSRVVFVSYVQTTERINAFQFAYNCVSPHIL